MKVLKFLFLISCILAFAKCSKKLDKLQGSDIRHLERNTIVWQNGTTPLPFYNDPNAIIVYLVRHAEKESDGTRDPKLSDLGIQRATKLVKIFQETQMDEVYSTPYQRTRMTAKPVAEIKRLSLQDYDPSQLSAFAERLKKEKKGKRILVSGHSNTTPTLVNLLIGNEVYEQIDESDYSNFYIVALSGDGETKYLNMKF